MVSRRYYCDCFSSCQCSDQWNNYYSIRRSVFIYSQKQQQRLTSHNTLFILTKTRSINYNSHYYNHFQRQHSSTSIYEVIYDTTHHFDYQNNDDDYDPIQWIHHNDDNNNNNISENYSFLDQNNDENMIGLESLESSYDDPIDSHINSVDDDPIIQSNNKNDNNNDNLSENIFLEENTDENTVVLESLVSYDDENYDDNNYKDNNDNSSITTYKVLSLDDMSQIFAKNVSYFYLKNELKLSEETLWRITYEASSALGMRTETIRNKIQILYQYLNVTNDDINIILSRNPTLLHLSADENIKPTILFIQSSLELNTNELKKLIVENPSIISYSIFNLKTKFKFFTKYLQFTKSETRILLLKESNLIRSSVTTGLVPHVKFLLNELELSIETIQLIVKKNPKILLYSIEENIIPKLIHYMILTLHMDIIQVQKILIHYPNILDYHYEHHILPITDYFVNEIQFSISNEFRFILMKYPKLMSLSLIKIKHVVNYLRYGCIDILQLNDIQQIKRILYYAPQILGLRTETNIQYKLLYIQNSYQLTNEQLRHIIVTMPTLLLLNIENNIKPKTLYLLNLFHNIIPLLRETILRLPTLLGYSLQNRLIPRIDAIMIHIFSSSSTSLSLLSKLITASMPMSQIQFDKWLQRKIQKQNKQKLLLSSSAITKTTSKKDNKAFLLDSDKRQLNDHNVPPDRIMHWTRERRPISE